MTSAHKPRAPVVQAVFHPTDFSEASDNAFVHALAISVLRQTSLTILHAGENNVAGHDGHEYPAVCQTLKRWDILPEESNPDLQQLGIDVREIDKAMGNPVKACSQYLKEHPTDLLVLATHGKEGLPAWIRSSKAEILARHSRTMTLFVPEWVKGFVQSTDGDINIRRILIPVDQQPDPQDSVEYATRMALIISEVGAEPIEIILLHIGLQQEMPDVPIDDNYPHWFFTHEVRMGHIADKIEEVAEEFDVDLIIMPTEGHHGIYDALRGSTTDQVLRNATCPLLAIPVKRS